MKHPTRRAEYEIVVQPDVRPHWRKRTAVDVLFVPDWETAARMLLERMSADEAT